MLLLATVGGFMAAACLRLHALGFITTVLVLVATCLASAGPAPLFYESRAAVSARVTETLQTLNPRKAAVPPPEAPPAAEAAGCSSRCQAMG